MTDSPIDPGMTLEALAAEVLAILSATLTNPAARPADDWNGGTVMQFGSVFPFMDQNQYHRVGAWIMDNPRNNPLNDGGITQFTVQSVSDTVNGMHISALAPGTGIAPGQNVAFVRHTSLAAIGKTIYILCDDGASHEGRITSVGPNAMSFEPPMPAGMCATDDGTGFGRVTWSRSAHIIGSYAAGTSQVAAASVMTANYGDAVRINLADGTVHLSTVTSAVIGDPCAISFADPLPSAVADGAFIRLGTEDVDPSVTFSRASARAIPGDHGPALIFVQGETGNDRKAATSQVAQLYTRAVQPDRALPNYAFDLVIGMADPEHPGGARSVFTIRNGLRAANRGFEPGLGAVNVNGVAVNDGELCIFHRRKRHSPNFGTLPVGAFTTVDVQFPGVEARDEITITVHSIAPDLAIRGFSESAGWVRLVGQNIGTAAASFAPNVSILASRFVEMTLPA